MPMRRIRLGAILVAVCVPLLLHSQLHLLAAITPNTPLLLATDCQALPLEHKQQ